MKDSSRQGLLYLRIIRIFTLGVKEFAYLVSLFFFFVFESGHH